MDGLPPPAPGAGRRRGRWRAVKDYQERTRTSHGRTEPLALPSSNVIAYELEGGAQVTLRPSGTEPKIKYYFELPERLGPAEGVEAARERGAAHLAQLEQDFLALAVERGQPQV